MTFSVRRMTTCPICGEAYPAGQGHMCLDLFGAMSSSSTDSDDYWTCSVCGQRVPKGELHVCRSRTYNGSSQRNTIPTLEERRVQALERIADALEKLLYEQK